jgi:hypothetical protein
MNPWRNSDFWISEIQTSFQRSNAFSVFRNSKPGDPNIKVVPNSLEHALEKFELRPNPFDMVLAQIDLGARHSDTGTLVTLQLPVPSLKLHDVHTQKTKQGQVNKSFTAILPKFAKICTQPALELGQRQRAHMFDRGWHLQFTPVRAPAPPSARPRALAGPWPPVHRAVPIKPPQASAILPPRALQTCPSQRLLEFAPSTPRHHPPSFQSLGRRGQPTPVTPKSRQRFG